MTHLIDDDTESFGPLDDIEDRVAVNLPRPTPLEALERWRLRPVSIRSRSPLETNF